jgi:hypothetical protein
MMAAWSLPVKEWDALEQQRFGTSNAAVFRRAMIILMSATGRSRTSLANDLGCTVGTVDVARQRYRHSRPDGLNPAKPTRRVSRATTEFRVALRKAVETAPQALGYGFSL